MPAYTLVTFGCQMNQHDSDRIGEVLRGIGYDEVSEPAHADLVVLNTCSIREKAEQKLRSEVGRLGLLKQTKPGLVIGVAGCMAQQEGERLARRMPQIDFMLGPDNIPELPSLLAEVELGGPPRVRTVFDLDAPQFLSARAEPGKSGPTAFVTIMKGCDERCTYCVVPYTRGAERYRPAREILDEVRRLVDAGVREVTLLGQTVNSYRDPEHSLARAPGAGESHFQHTLRAVALEDESEFPALLRAIAERSPELDRLRYTSPHPRHLTWSLILAHRDLPLLARHVHMPVQSGSDRVLKRMLRRYTVDEYVERVTALRAEVPGLTLSTDVIVGFPGETRADFEATLNLTERVRFTGFFGFTYSERPNTPALKLEDDVPAPEKSARLEQIFELTDRHRKEHLTSLVGRTERVLVERRGKNGDYMGRSEQNEIVHFAAAADVIGWMVPVRISEAYNNSLRGQIAEDFDPSRERPRVLFAAEAQTKPIRRSLPVVTEAG
ncbi:MAG TPA: tRNA (N6-isopentenyl adenosine(37)-C2)-methylthiotransferase MiaB [Polyangiaceae bacterium]|jgi:tRNA-2-methylthio-N6-dimethylallyladenosine synthase|nr:tRNA (N6-isopentenyl adenosine(37)-C2)-methylthiotransferase MiaB [Polyangiaceae bacterium]